MRVRGAVYLIINLFIAVVSVEMQAAKEHAETKRKMRSMMAVAAAVTDSGRKADAKAGGSVVRKNPLLDTATMFEEGDPVVTFKKNGRRSKASHGEMDVALLARTPSVE